MYKPHELKTVSPYFEAVRDGKKTFEIRKNDRDFSMGDIVILRHFEKDGTYSNCPLIIKQIGFITDYEQKPGYVVFSLLDLK